MVKAIRDSHVKSWVRGMSNVALRESEGGEKGVELRKSRGYNVYI